MNNKGASLLEIVIAIGLVGVILMSLVALSTKTVSNSTISREKNQATRYTQELIEWVRQQRDDSWSGLNSRITTNTTWCMTAINWDNPGACTESKVIPGTPFRRQAEFNRLNANTIELTVVTQWVDSGNLHESRASTILTKWQ